MADVANETPRRSLRSQLKDPRLTCAGLAALPHGLLPPSGQAETQKRRGVPMNRRRTALRSYQAGQCSPVLAQDGRDVGVAPPRPNHAMMCQIAMSISTGRIGSTHLAAHMLPLKIEFA